MLMATKPQAQIGIIGGSGFYSLAPKLTEIKVNTPFGPASDKLAIGTISGKKVAFLPRHNKNHDIPPHKINYKANIWALHSLGVSQIITVTACGSLKSQIKPGDFVIVDQFIDRTVAREDSFYNGSVVTHISSAFPYCPRLNKIAYTQAKKLKLSVHSKGTVVVINGPRFSSAAESLWFTQMNWDIVNMTQYPEVILAKELALCYCAIALVTDYDAGLVDKLNQKPVSTAEILKVFSANIEKSKSLLLNIIANLSTRRPCSCSQSLDQAVIMH